MPFWAWLPPIVATAAAGTWWALRYARRRQLVDLPGERRSHAAPTPRGGGIGIVLALLAAVLIGVITGGAPPLQAAAFGIGLLLVAGTGWLDDHRPLSPWGRLIVQCFAGMIVASGLYGLDARWEWWLLTAVAVPVLVNVWNFMDGIDGLAASQAMLAALFLALLAGGQGSGLGWVLAAACCGFLPFNFPRARIFLGDVGSGALGYTLAVLVAMAADGRMRDAGPGQAFIVLLPISAFLVDASLTLAGRMLRGERWWLPHVCHLYQRWVRTGRSHVFVTGVYALFSFVDGILALVLSRSEGGLAVGITVVWFALAALLWFFGIRATSTDRKDFAG